VGTRNTIFGSSKRRKTTITAGVSSNFTIVTMCAKAAAWTPRLAASTERNPLSVREGRDVRGDRRPHRNPRFDLQECAEIACNYCASDPIILINADDLGERVSPAWMM
jgi:hypothetical protein